MNHILALPPMRYAPYVPAHHVDSDPSASSTIGSLIGLGVVIVIVVIGYYLTRPDSDQKRKSHSSTKRKGQRQQPRKGASAKKRTLTRQR